MRSLFFFLQPCSLQACLLFTVSYDIFYVASLASIGLLLKMVMEESICYFLIRSIQSFQLKLKFLYSKSQNLVYGRVPYHS